MPEQRRGELRKWRPAVIGRGFAVRGRHGAQRPLGERRALASREYLANLGVDPQRIKTVTYGASKPVATGHSEASWSKNRRGDLVLVTPK